MAGNGVPRRARGEERGNRILVFWIEVAFLLFLGLLGWAYFTPAAPSWLRAPATFGVLPSGVLWFGAVGGVLISLAGIHEHRYDWDSRFWTWHLIRPFVGAAVATVAVIIVMSGILAIGGDPTPTPAADGADGEATATADTVNLFYFLVAFVVGYREAHFRDLIKRLGDVLFTSKDEAKAAASIVSIDPPQGPAAGGTVVRIAGSGLNGVTAVKFGSVEGKFEIVSDAQIDVTTPEGEAGEEVSVAVVTPAGTAMGGTFTYEE